MSPAVDKYGYLYYVLCVDGNRRTVKAHRLVAKAFIDNPQNKPTVDHINGIKTDNRVENLMWATNKEQTANPNTKEKLDAAHLKTNYRLMGEKRDFGRRKIKISTRDGTEVVFDSMRDAARATGISYSKMSEIANGKRPQRKWIHIEVLIGGSEEKR